MGVTAHRSSVRLGSFRQGVDGCHYYPQLVFTDQSQELEAPRGSYFCPRVGPGLAR